MGKTTYNYTDWYQGRVYLETGAISINKTDSPIKAHLSDFSASSLKKIQSKQKEIFDTKCSNKLTKFKNIFTKRLKDSETKELLLKREIEDNKQILFFTPGRELLLKNRTSTFSKDDLLIIREYVNTQIVKGEKYYGFVHSPNFKFAYEKDTDDLVYARATFDYYNWLLKLSEKNKSISISNKHNNLKQVNSKAEKIKVKVIALKYFYNNIAITRKNGMEIAAKYNYIESTSGEGLFQDYTKFRENNGRIKVNDESKIRCNNRLKLIGETINHLKGKAKEHAKKDYENLEKAIEKHIW